jgi:hypothetical protein
MVLEPAAGLCEGDLDGDGFIGVQDLVLVLLGWGSSGVPADFNGDGIVDIHDMIHVILHWGPC